MKRVAITILGALGVLFITAVFRSVLEAVPPEVSRRCDVAVMQASDVPLHMNANRYIIQSLRDCKTADEWLAAVKRHPEAMGMTGPEYVDDVALQTACGPGRKTPVCRDARKQGRLPAGQ